MLKITMLIVIGVIVLVGVADATVGVSCLADSGCGIGECCHVSYGGHGGPLMVGKRQVTGLCQMMATLNQQCEPSTSVRNGVHAKCPCASGYICQSTGMVVVPFGPIPKFWCYEKDDKLDFGTDEYNRGWAWCCQVSYGGHGGPQMVGRRQVTGLCHMMGTDTVNKQCEPSTTVHNGLHRKCQCASGYTCVNTGLYEVPFGPIRNCQKQA